MACARPPAPGAVCATAQASLIPLFRLLAGRWAGAGSGFFPTIEPFTYEEEVEFTSIPDKPILAYTQRTWAGDSGRTKPLHSETGYLRFVPGGSPGVELLVSQPSGIVEILEGEATAGQEGSEEVLSFLLVSKALDVITRAKQPSAVSSQRAFHLVKRGDNKYELEYTMGMSTTTVKEMTPHLKCKLAKVQ